MKYTYDEFQQVKENPLIFYGLMSMCEAFFDKEISEEDFYACLDIYFDSDTMSLDSDYKECLSFLFPKYTAKGEILKLLEPFDYSEYIDDVQYMDMDLFIHTLKSNFDMEDLEPFVEDINNILVSYGLDKYKL